MGQSDASFSIFFRSHAFPAVFRRSWDDFVNEEPNRPTHVLYFTWCQTLISMHDI